MFRPYNYPNMPNFSSKLLQGLMPLISRQVVESTLTVNEDSIL